MDRKKSEKNGRGGKKKIYISLPITGYGLQERMHYADMAKRAAEDFFGPGSRVVTPFDICEDLSLPYSRLMARDIQEIMESDAVMFCKGWPESRGCRIEMAVAREMELEIFGELCG